MVENTQKMRRVIILPDDEKRKQQLQAKLAEYRERKKRRGSLFSAHAFYKLVVLERLLRDGKVVVGKMFKEMGESHKEDFDGFDFWDACEVIDDYCKTGGQNVSGGTGLPMVK